MDRPNVLEAGGGFEISNHLAFPPFFDTTLIHHFVISFPEGTLNATVEQWIGAILNKVEEVREHYKEVTGYNLHME